MTIKPGLTSEQLEARKTGIGGSDAAAVLGCDPFRTAVDVYNEKTGAVLQGPEGPHLKRGRYLEPVAAQLYSELTGRKIRRQPQRRHASYPWMQGNVDRQILGDDRGPGVLELKCPALWTFAKIQREGSLPLRWVVQIQHYLEVFGYSWGSFALFNADKWEMIHFDVERDTDLAAALVVKEQQFWQMYVEKQIPPPLPEPSADVVAALAKAQQFAGDAKVIVRNDPEWGDAARTYLEADELYDTAESLLDTAKERLQALMGEQEAVEGCGLRVYWREQEGRTTFDHKKLAQLKPIDPALLALHLNGALQADILAEVLEKSRLDLTVFEKVSKGSRPFKPYRVSAGVGD